MAYADVTTHRPPPKVDPGTLVAGQRSKAAATALQTAKVAVGGMVRAPEPTATQQRAPPPKQVFEDTSAVDARHRAESDTPAVEREKAVRQAQAERKASEVAAAAEQAEIQKLGAAKRQAVADRKSADEERANAATPTPQPEVTPEPAVQPADATAASPATAGAALTSATSTATATATAPATSADGEVEQLRARLAAAEAALASTGKVPTAAAAAVTPPPVAAAAAKKEVEMPEKARLRKERATVAFKNGQFGDAAQLYTETLEILEVSAASAPPLVGACDGYVRLIACFAAQPAQPAQPHNRTTAH
jgi:hypothetical protein